LSQNLRFSVLFAEPDNIAVLNIPKCASQTIQGAELVNIGLDQVPADMETFAFVRHPIERIQSAYRFFMGYRHLLPPEVIDYETFIDYTFTVDDLHWTPQHHMVFPYGDAVVKQIHRLESMTTVLKEWLGYGLETHNASLKDYLVSDYRLDDLLVKYQADMEMYNGLR
jgi:hypothetical protein